MKTNSPTDFTRSQIAITLSTIAYWETQTQDGFTTELSNKNYATAGKYYLQWGPVAQSGFLAYIAAEPVSGDYYVAIRGTSTADIYTVVENLKTDLDYFTVVPLTYPSVQGALIANGINNAVNAIANMQSNGQTIQKYLSNTPNITKLTVTGHSLGGAIASVLCPYLQTVLNRNNIEYHLETFAAPSAGNITFANYLNSQYGSNMVRHFNGLDIIRKFYSVPNDIVFYYNDIEGLPITSPAIDNGIYNVLISLIKKLKSSTYNGQQITYAQPNGKEWNDNTLINNGGGWVSEAYYQHSCTRYLKYLGAPDVSFSLVEQEVMDIEVARYKLLNS